MRALIAALVLTGCADPSLTVARRDAVREGGALIVRAIGADGDREIARRVVGADDFPLTLGVGGAGVDDRFRAILVDGDGHERAAGDGDLAHGLTLDPADERVDVVRGQARFGAPATSGHQLALMPDGGFAIAWQQNQLIRARMFDPTGAPRRDLAGTDLGVARIAPRDPAGLGETRSAASLVAIDDHLVFGHEATASITTRVELATLGAALEVGPPIAPALFAGATTDRAPIAAPLGRDGLALAWLAAFDPTGDEPIGSIRIAIRTADGDPVGNADLAGALGPPQLAPLGDGIAVAYADLDARTIELARFDRQGHPIGAATIAPAAEPLVRIAPRGDGGVIAWLDRSGGAVLQVAAIATDGTVGAPIELARAAAIDGLALATAPDGTPWLAWSEGAGDPNGATQRVWWLALDGELHPRGTARRASSTELPQIAPSIAARDRDRAIVTWIQSPDQAGAEAANTEVRVRMIYAAEDGDAP